MYDVIVLGSGAAGLTAAFTAAHEGARVAVFEKHDRIGGTSAWSGGHVWIPGNPHMAGIGAADGPEEAMAYLMSLGRGIVDERLVRAFVENGPRMAAYLEKHGGVAFFAVPGLPDYYPSNPGGKPGGGRTMAPSCSPSSGSASGGTGSSRAPTTRPTSGWTRRGSAPPCPSRRPPRNVPGGRRTTSAAWGRASSACFSPPASARGSRSRRRRPRPTCCATGDG